MPTFSAESRDRLAAGIDQHNYQIVAKETWGHLAPRKNVAYAGFVRFAVGCFGSDKLNPTVLHYELKSRRHELDSSPWFYEALEELLQDWAAAGRFGHDPLPDDWPKIEPGGVYEWRGTFRNYAFKGTLRRMTLC